MSNGYFKENYKFPRYRRGSNIFQWGGGVQLVQMLVSIETHLTCDFPGSANGFDNYETKVRVSSVGMLFLIRP